MEDTFNTHMGKRLRMRRLSLGLTQTKVANAINVTFQQIQKYEKGTNGVSSSRLMQLANFLKVPITYFYEDFPSYKGENLIETSNTDLNYSFLVKTFSKLSDTDKNIEQAFGRSDSMISDLFGTTTKKLMDVVTSFVLPAKNAIVAGLSLKSKKDQSKVFKEAARVANAEKTENVENHGPSEFSEMLKYAIGKIWYGIKTQIWKIIKNVTAFVNNLLLIIPSPVQPVAAIIKTGQKIMDATLAAAGWLKKGYQKAFGQKKIKNANYILDSALAGDQKALKLIFDLKLGSVAGTGVGKFDWIMQKLGIVFDPVNGMSGDRVVDLIGVGGPKDVKELHLFLNKVSSNGASRKFLISDLAEAMTGTGTSF